MTAALLKQAREAQRLILSNWPQERDGMDDEGPLPVGVKALRTSLTALDAHAALSPAPVEALPEGCPETATWSPSWGGIYGGINPTFSDGVAVEIHPVGTRARLAALDRAASLPDAKNFLDARCICGHTFGEHGPELNCGMFVPSSDDSERATPPVTNKGNPHA